MSAVPKASLPPASSLPDEALVAAAVSGDSGALDSLFVRHRDAALRTASRIVGKDAAEDIVQDALLLACRFISSLEEPAKFDRWLTAIVRFRAFRELRKETRWKRGRVDLDDGVIATISLVAFSKRRSEEGDEEILEALTKMPPEYGEVLRYHFLHGLPHARIAELGGVPLSTIKYRCSRGKVLLREILLGRRAAVPRRVESVCRACPPNRGGTCTGGPHSPSRAPALAPACAADGDG